LYFSSAVAKNWLAAELEVKKATAESTELAKLSEEETKRIALITKALEAGGKRTTEGVAHEKR
jgi:hypothetical protein